RSGRGHWSGRGRHQLHKCGFSILCQVRRTFLRGFLQCFVASAHGCFLFLIRSLSSASCVGKSQFFRLSVVTLPALPRRIHCRHHRQHRQLQADFHVAFAVHG